MTTITYRGHGNTTAAGGRLVTVERGEQVVGPLRHIVRHSPTGMSWGYGGSGPADLARSLLIDALGDQSTCATCRGSCLVVYDAELDKEIAAIAADGADEATDRYSDKMRCVDCDGGYRNVPYQQFKWEVVADLPEEGWTLDQSEVLAWLQKQRDAQHRSPF